MSVIPLNARATARRAALDAAAAPMKPTGYVTLQPAARNAFTSLKGRMSALDRLFSGSFATAAGAAEIDRICEHAMADLQRVRDFSR